jgi:hypothetical protein
VPSVIFIVEPNGPGFMIKVHTYDGIFSGEEPGVATNFAIPSISTLSFDDIMSAKEFKNANALTSVRDSVYRTFCILIELWEETVSLRVTAMPLSAYGTCLTSGTPLCRTMDDIPRK